MRMPGFNEAHDPALLSWVDSVNTADTYFPIQNLPFAMFQRRGTSESFRGGVAISDCVLDLDAVAKLGLLSGVSGAAVQAATQGKLNTSMALGNAAGSALRVALSSALHVGASEQTELQACLVPQSEVEYDVTARIGDYNDFYTSVHHATHNGKKFRPDNPLSPYYKWVPIGYHGYSSSIGVSGECFQRPQHQTLAPGAAEPVLMPSKRVDLELELGVFVCSGNALGQPVSIAEAEDRVFGFYLLNDWSERDVQAWEYQPLGPFLSKNFATTIAPWILNLEALAPYRLPFTRSTDDPQPLPYLDLDANRAQGSIEIQLKVGLLTIRMKSTGELATTICRTSYRHAYWTFAQMLMHHCVNGCNPQPGDPLGSGILSGPMLDQAGALIELTQSGKNPLQLSNDESRMYLEDGDTVQLKGWCEKSDAVRIGFGDCIGTLFGALRAEGAPHALDVPATIGPNE